MGIDSTSITSLDASEGLKIITQLCTEAGWNCKQAGAIRKYLMTTLKKLSADNPWSSFTLNNVEEFSPMCLAHFATSDLENMNNDVRKTICKKIGTMTRLQCCLSPAKRVALADACFKYLDENDDGKISEEEASFLGSLLPYSQELIEKLDETTIDNRASFFRKSCLSKTSRSYIINKLKKKRGAKPFTGSEVTKYGSLIAEFDENLYKSIRLNLVESAQDTLSDIEINVDDQDEADGENDMVCCERDFSSDDLSYYRLFKIKVCFEQSFFDFLVNE